MVLSSFNTFGNITKGTVNQTPSLTITNGTNGPSGAALIYFTPGTGTISNYKYSTNGVNYTALSPPQTTSPLTIIGLSNGTTYNITIQSISNLGTSPSSNSVSVTPYYPFQTKTKYALPQLSNAISWEGICCDTTGRYVMVGANNRDVKFSQDYGVTFVDMSTYSSGTTKPTSAYRMACDRSGKYAAIFSYNNVFQICVNCLDGATAVWTQPNDSNNNPLNERFTDACFATNNTSIIIYAVQDGAYIWKTTFLKTATSGQGYPGVPLIFNQIGDTTSRPGYTSICCSSNGKYVATCISYEGIKYSQDYGATFSDATVDTGAFLSIKCSITGKYMVAGIGSGDVIWSSQDYGATWTQNPNGIMTRSSNLGCAYMDDSGYNAAFISADNYNGDYVHYSTTANLSGGLVTVAYTGDVANIGNYGAGICGSSNCKYVYYTGGETARAVYRLTSS
jgi:hypothetical protein